MPFPRPSRQAQAHAETEHRRSPLPPALAALLLALLLGAPALAAPALQPGAFEEEAGTELFPRGPLPGDILYDSIQFHIGGAFSITSQAFVGVTLPDGRTVSTFGADDFTVDGFGWTIDQVEVKGNYFAGSGPADGVNIYILGDAGGLPDTTDIPASALAVYEGLPFVDNTPAAGDLVIPLPASLELPPGTYWLVVQVDLAFPNQWGWTSVETSPGSGAGVGYRGAWMQNATVVAAGCVEAWGDRITTCGIAGDGAPDFGFILRGVRAEPPAVAVPTLSHAALGLLALLVAWVGLAVLRR